MTTSSWNATLALRIRVSMSAIGSVMVMGRPLPRGLRHAGNLAGVRHLPEADPAQPELAVHGAGAAAPTAAGVGPHGELRLALLLLDEGFLGQRGASYELVSRRNGKPSARRSARPWSSVDAVVTMVT